MVSGAGLTLTEAPSLLMVVIVGGGAPQPAVAPSVRGALRVLLPLEEEGEDAGLSAGRTPVHQRNYNPGAAQSETHTVAMGKPSSPSHTAYCCPFRLDLGVVQA